MSCNTIINNRAVCYVRGAAHGQAMLDQETACRRFAERWGLNVQAVIREVGSGLALTPGLERLITRVRTQPVDHIIVSDASRLARNRVLDLALRDMFKRAGARLRIVDEEDDR